MESVYINGVWESGEGATRPVINPATEETLAVIKDASDQQVDRAVQAAKDSQAIAWEFDVERRLKVLRKVSGILSEKVESFAKLEADNVGKPIREARMDIEDTIAVFNYYIEIVEHEELTRMEQPDGTYSEIHYDPVGVCALIVPWNFPLLLSSWKLAPALAAGNAIVIKPSEATPLTLIKFVKILEEAGVPAGVVNLLVGDGKVGTRLVENSLVDKISFTGSVAVGKEIYAHGARHMKRISLELGGKSALIIDETVHLPEAVEWALFAAYFNQGEVCVAAPRLLVHSSIEREFTKQLLARLERMQIGSPREEATELGPLIHEAHLEKVILAVQSAKADGATILHGGKRLNRKGYYVTPALITGVTNEMAIVQEEVFGPVATIQTYKTEEEAIALANSTKYGLAAGVFSKDIEKAKKISRHLQAGTVWINSYHTPYVNGPWGGRKESGVGRELGREGLAGYRETKHVNITEQPGALGWYQS